jgi:hypothetical protein
MGDREREGGRRQTDGWEGDEHTRAGCRWVRLELAPIYSMVDLARPAKRREVEVEAGGEEVPDLPGRRSIWFGLKLGLRGQLLLIALSQAVVRIARYEAD